MPNDDNDVQELASGRGATLAEAARELVQNLRHRQLVEEGTERFVEGIFACMKQKGLTLEAAITSVSSYLDLQLNEQNANEEKRAFNGEVLEAATEEARSTLAYAREIIQADDEGSSQPVPPEVIVAERDEFVAAQQAGGSQG